MTQDSRRSFLRSMGQGSLAAAMTSILPTYFQAAPLLAQDQQDQNPPITGIEASLRRINPEPWLKVDDRNVFLKGMAFDRHNNLTVLAAYPGPDASKGLAGRTDRRLLSISPDKKITTLIQQNRYRFVDHAIHKDGRIVIACLSGELLLANPDGSDLRPIATRVAGKPQAPSDLTFDSAGNLYVTDFTGAGGNKSPGGVFRFRPDFEEVELFGPNLVTPNGLAFSPDEHTLWVACSLAKKLFRLTLDAPRGKVVHAESVYDLNGPGADGIRVDLHGNVYLALNFQGRLLVFNKEGKAIATVLMPGREQGALLSTTNLEFLPGTNEAYAVAAGDPGGAWIYKFKGLAKGEPEFSHL